MTILPLSKQLLRQRGLPQLEATGVWVAHGHPNLEDDLPSEHKSVYRHQKQLKLGNQRKHFVLGHQFSHLLKTLWLGGVSECSVICAAGQVGMADGKL